MRVANMKNTAQSSPKSSQHTLGLIPVIRSRLHEEIVAQIQKKILSGNLQAGEKLPPERELAESLGVNRATLREALKKLEVLGLVEIRHGDGVYVKDYLESESLELLKSLIYGEDGVNADIMDSLLSARVALLPDVAALAAQKRTAAHVQKLKSIVEAGNSIPVLEADLAVHHTIARASGNIPVIFILNFFNTFFRSYGVYYFDNPENEKRSRKFHKDIYEAIAQGDSKKAKKIMKEVLVYAHRKTMQAIRGNNIAGGKI